MGFLLEKMGQSILQALNKILIGMLNYFLVQPIVLSDVIDYRYFLIISQVIGASMLVLSMMKDITFKMSGIEGNIMDLNMFEYVGKALMNIVAISAVPQIMLIIVEMSNDINQLLGKVAPKALSSSTGDVSNFLTKTMLGVTGLEYIIIFLVIILFAVAVCIKIAKLKIEILVAIIFCPIALADMFKSTDKFNSLMSKFIGTLVSLSVNIVLINIAFKKLLEITVDGDISKLIGNTIIIIAICLTAIKPTIISDIIQGSGVGGSIGSTARELMYSRRFLK